jgi:hypothetical protein
MGFGVINSTFHRLVQIKKKYLPRPSLKKQLRQSVKYPVQPFPVHHPVHPVDPCEFRFQKLGGNR